MEIEFVSETMNCYSELSCQSRIVQEAAECVVPDTQDDIGEIADVESCIFLKSKDITPGGVEINAELQATVMYINEGRDQICSAKLTKALRIEYEVPDITQECRVTIELDVLGAEARAVNPRKLGAAFEVAGNLCCYKPEELRVLSYPPQESAAAVHTLEKNLDITPINAVCEKTFALSEQFTFPTGRAGAGKLCFCDAELNVSDTQLIGSRLIAKGSMDVKVCCFAEEGQYPVYSEFSRPFSQIIDITQEQADIVCVHIEKSGEYCELVDTISSERVLNIELHAVMQTVCRCETQLRCVADAYSNLMPSECVMEHRAFRRVRRAVGTRLQADERIELIPECVDMLSAVVRPAGIRQEGETIRAVLKLYALCRDRSGLLASVHRQLELISQLPAADVKIIKRRLCDVYLRPELPQLSVRAAFELEYMQSESTELDEARSISLDEENAYAQRDFPSLTMVRVDDESLWSLAKTYHSSPEKISQYNDTESISGRMLMIVKDN